MPARIWLDLESAYRLARAREQEAGEGQRLKQETRWLAPFRYAELARLGAVAARTRAIDKVRDLQRFFGVASLDSVMEVHRYQAAFRCGQRGGGDRQPHAIAAWLRLGELRAREIESGAFDRPALMAALPTIRSMTRSAPEEFPPRLIAELAEAGVALVIQPHLKGTGAHGAVFWLGRERPTILLTIRGRWADVFWFSLFHEIGHILLHGPKAVFIEDDCTPPELQAKEAEANRFAADRLIPPPAYRRFCATGSFTPDAIAAFADDIGVHPGIVVGRLHHDGLLRHDWGNKLRIRYDWADDTARAPDSAPGPRT